MFENEGETNEGGGDIFEEEGDVFDNGGEVSDDEGKKSEDLKTFGGLGKTCDDVGTANVEGEASDDKE